MLLFFQDHGAEGKNQYDVTHGINLFHSSYNKQLPDPMGGGEGQTTSAPNLHSDREDQHYSSLV